MRTTMIRDQGPVWPGFCRALLTMAILATATIPAPSVRAADDVGALLAKVTEVGPAGQGHREATVAWRKLSQAPAARLPQLLAAIDGANPLAANWLRGAIEAIAQTARDRGQPLPMAELESFLHDTSHAPRARRLAYELVAINDPTAADRLVPGFLNDPSVELRRDAVARLLSAGEAAQTAERAAEAQALFEEALGGARDMDQVELLATKLKALGREVDLARHFGFLMQWKLLGPFDNTGSVAFDTAYPPEEKLDVTASYEGRGQTVAWIDHTTADRLGMVDLNQGLGKHKGAVAYATTSFVAPEARAIELRLGCTNANKVWLNGRLLGGNNFYHAGEFVDQYVFRGQLRAGDNQILVKVLQNEQTESWAQVWQFQLRVCDAAGTAVLSADRVALAAPGK